jgi:predicted methyltransferase
MGWHQKPYTCPVCGGRGVVKKEFYTAFGGDTTYSASGVEYEACHTCKGTGIVWGNGYEYDPLPPTQPWIAPDRYIPPSPVWYCRMVTH